MTLKVILKVNGKEVRKPTEVLQLGIVQTGSPEEPTGGGRGRKPLVPLEADVPPNYILLVTSYLFYPKDDHTD